jgi:hypothetical protein
MNCLLMSSSRLGPNPVPIIPKQGLFSCSSFDVDCWQVAPTHYSITEVVQRLASLIDCSDAQKFFAHYGWLK